MELLNGYAIPFLLGCIMVLDIYSLYRNNRHRKMVKEAVEEVKAYHEKMMMINKEIISTLTQGIDQAEKDAKKNSEKRMHGNTTGL